MDEGIAKLIFAVIMASGFIAWLCSLALALRIGVPSAESDGRRLDARPRRWYGTESSSRTVRGTPEKLSKALARTLTQLNVGAFGSLFEITERTDAHIELVKTGPLVCNQPAGLYFSEAAITFEPLGNNSVKVTYVLGYDRLAHRVRAIALAIIFCIGLPVMLIVGGVIWRFVLPSENPAIRWQVLQSLQIAHALWPPFLLLWLYSLGRRQSKTYFSNLLSTLELAD